ncbi:NADP-dependent oxidoreductase [Mangrovicella endophytica]|uniref:NADP-dependent oxidoreductase n=1 Tax=Mangrovicella endophytica TaxID=2066697 RepID=UPI000C9EBC4B|nr:NADP-dependent oxidoreductase [Mangrovicella endophytica]
MSNQRVLLVRRPQGVARPDDFTLVDQARPRAGEGEVLLRNLFLSLDPYMRGRMNDGDGSYAAPYALGEPPGGGTVAEVVSSTIDGFRSGDLVVANGGWQAYAVSDGSDLYALPGNMARPSLALGVLGMTGFAAWHGLTAIGSPQPGETLVVGAATGAVGAVVGQIGKIFGCRVVGIAGGERKCRHAVEVLGFDACLDHRTPGLSERLADAAPSGVDVYFENVGGAVRAAVWPLLNVGARVPVCGLVSGYNGDGVTDGSLHELMMSLIIKRIRMEGFMIADHYGAEFETFSRQMSGWVSAGKIHADEDIVDGLENAPEAFVGMLEGRNLGKTLVRIRHG